MHRFLHLVISFLLTAVILYIIHRGVPDWATAARVMVGANPVWIAAGLVLLVFHVSLRAERWGVLLTPTKSGISRKNLISLTLVKYVVNVIPPRMGELAASLLLARKENIPAAPVIAASVLERILDMVTVVVLFGFYLCFFAQRYLPNSERGKQVILAVREHSVVIFLLLSLGMTALIFLMHSKGWQAWIPGPIRRLVLSFLDGFRALHSGRLVVRVLVLSVAIWLVITAQLWCFTLAYVEHFPMAGALLTMVLTVIGVAIPTPGGVGGFQFFMSFTLINFFRGYLSARDPYSEAAGISNGSYILIMIPLFAAGLWQLNREGLTFGTLASLTHQDDGQSQARQQGNRPDRSR